ncbi:MAG TPA: GreA/GreB family elongation factor [Rhabdochlamydiaceae bacterium]|nr:GreA/GreB family elongation factor [Rhabdochlamydiaceae bacterium]
MSYLKDFQTQISNHNYPAYMRLWEEYCLSDEVDPLELKTILVNVKASEFGEPFGKYVEKIIPLWEMLPESPQKHEIFKLIIEIETTNHEQLRQMVMDYLQKRYGDDKGFAEKIRLIGLRGKENFQGAVSNFELLNHMMKGKFVFHTGGWGVGEIMDVSMIREQLSVEFEYVPGKKDISFANAFNTLIPIPDDHFLALRFGNADLLEEKAKENPVEVIRLLLRDLGPKTAAEIKDELCELVIPEEAWAKWWQNTRTKIKKDTMIEAPEDLRQPFVLRLSEVTHEDRLRKLLEGKPDVNHLIQMVYSFMRDFPETLKNSDFKAFLQAKLHETLNYPDLTDGQLLQLHFFLEDLSDEKKYTQAQEIVKNSKAIEALVQSIEVLAYKKRALIVSRKVRSDWKELFLNLLLTIDQNPLRDYIFGELSQPETEKDLKRKLEDLWVHPSRYPEVFLWYFQKIMAQEGLPFSDKAGKNRFFEALFVLLNYVEQSTAHRELVKKIHNIITQGRYAFVREIMQGASVETLQEFLLLASKCHSLSDHDQKILHSLAEVVQPSMVSRKKQDNASDSNVIWTTEAGFNKVKDRIQQIATVETVRNAKEIETARSHGDLRENAEFKSALEKRDRLQSELKGLSDQANRARVLTKADVSTDEVSVGCIVEFKNNDGKLLIYTILGPWDADPNLGILSFQSKLAQEMKGLSVGDKIKFQGEEFTITTIRSYLDK